MSRKGGLSLIRREEQGDAVSEILGDLDGHLDRSWLVSMGDTRHDDDVFAWMYCRTAVEYTLVP